MRLANVNSLRVYKAKDGVTVYKEIENVLHKYCSLCKTYKPATNGNFNGGNSNKLKLSSWCRTCINEDRIDVSNIDLTDKILDCKRCGDTKPALKFNYKKNVQLRFNRSYVCKICDAKSQLLRYNSLKGNLDEYIKKLLFSSKNRSKKKIYDFDLTFDFIKSLYIKQDGKCALTNAILTYDPSHENMKDNMSIDRIDSDKGYIQSNVQLVTWRVNVMKSDLSLVDLYQICEQILKYKN